MTHEIFVFIQRLLGLIGFLLLGVILGGTWLLMGVNIGYRNNGPAWVCAVLPPVDATDRALAAEVSFATTCPGQSYAVQWWGWSSTPSSSTEETPEPTPTKGDVFQAMNQASAKMSSKMAAKVDPWLRLVWIRGAGALAVLVAAVLPALALWLAGRRRAYALHLESATPSDGQRKTWLVIAGLLAVAAGFLIGAPFAIAMGPWITLALLGALAITYKVRACMAARI